MINHPWQRMMLNSFFLRACFVMVILAGLAILFYLPYDTVKKKTIDSHNTEQVFLARQAAQSIENTFKMYGNALRYFSSHPSIVNLDSQGQKMLYDFFAIHKPDLVSVARLDETGGIQHRISNSSVLDDEILQRSFTSIDAQQPEIVDVITPEITLAAFVWPVKDGDGSGGSLVFLVSFPELIKKYLTPLKKVQGKRLWIINHEGIVLECPNPAHSGAHISETTLGVDRNSSLLTVMKEMVRGGYGEGSFEIMDNRSENENPLLNHVVFMPIPLPGGNYWSIAYATPENMVLTNMRSFRNYWLLVSSIALFVLLLLSSFLIRSMTVADEEKKRHASEKQLLELMDFTPIGIIVYDVQGELKYANNAARHMWPSDVEMELSRVNIFDFIHPNYLDTARQRFKDVMRGINREPAVIKLVFPGNIEKSVETNTAPFYFSGQRCGVTVLQDVTQRLRNEEEQRRLATAIAHTNDSIVITDRDGIIEYVNPAFTRITGYSRKEAVGRNPRILKSGHQNGNFYHQMWQTLEQGNVWEGRLVNKNKAGKIFTEMASISPIRDSRGDITHFVAVKRDITHEVQLESQLQQAQKMEAIGTLAGGIAHDFNNILGAIIGFTDISLLETPVESSVHENLRQIKKSGQRAADLVQQILTFSRMAAQREKIHVCVAPLLKETLKLLRATIPTTIEIKLTIDDPECWVMANPVQIQQIIMNLCTNAFHAMSRDGGTLAITLSRLPLGDCAGIRSLSETDCLEIKVADSGHGIDAEIIDRIFDPFFTTKDPGVGTGMGLSVVHGIIQDLDGMITVDSDAGGTCFTVLLPAVEPPPQKDEEDFAAVQKGTESVLIVDDEQVIRDTCRMMLEQLGYRVAVSEKPQEALAMIRNPAHHFDLVISDQTMPEMTGLELLQQIKLVDPELPVILCTGFSEQVNEETARAMGARMYMMKPVNFTQLAVIVRQVLDAEAPGQEG